MENPKNNCNDELTVLAVRVFMRGSSSGGSLTSDSMYDKGVAKAQVRTDERGSSEDTTKQNAGHKSEV